MTRYFLLFVIKHFHRNSENHWRAKVAEVAYDQFVKTAEEAGDTGAVLHFSQSKDVEETHAKLYKQAMAHFMEERETTYYVCKIFFNIVPVKK